MINDASLLHYFQRGLIPGPTETEEEFLKRALQARSLTHSEWQEVSTPFAIAIDWVPLTYSNQQIAWWEGAATWISDEGLPSIQLRTRFQKGSFWGYRREEVLAHEAVHAARARFEEPQFEEILAYFTAPQAWKRFLGPLFSRSWEPLVLLLSVLIGAYVPLIPSAVIILALSWLIYRQRAFKRCCRKLSFPLLLCLTDREIRSFARMPEAAIPAYLDKNSTPRGRLLRLLFRRNGNRI
ncbi:MAG: hypothetical protein JSS10_04410 [Verrucomicrobia bacterium]|nr:hypothetical protein [Verrucomicrobiota bacterium]